MTHYTHQQQQQQQQQTYLNSYIGGSPNYIQQPPNTAIYPTSYDRNYQQNPYQQTQSQSEYPSQPYFVPSPAPNNTLSNIHDQLVPGSHSTGHSNMSDQMEPSANRYTPLSMPMPDNPLKNTQQPMLVINEQPKSAFRFRYNCEGSSHGALLGNKSEKGRKSYPSVNVENYLGHVVVVANLVPPKTDEPHPFSLTGKDVQNGLFLNVIRDGTRQGVEVRLKDLSILHVKKQEVMTALQHKYAVEWFIKTYGIYAYMQKSDAYNKKNTTTGDEESDESLQSFGASLFKQLRPEEKKALKDKAQKACEQHQPLTTVRLCFRGYLFNQQGQLMQEIGPTFSCPITDTKNCPSLKICKIDRCVGSIKGQDSVYLLCDKVSRDDIEVIFEEEKGGIVTWTGKGEFQPSDVHHQVAIVFTTPRYEGPSNTESIGCYIKLRKPTTMEESNPITYRYLLDDTSNFIGNKRKRMSDSHFIPNRSSATFDPAFQQLITTVPINENYMNQTPDPANMTTSLILDPESLLSTFPDLLNIQTLSTEAEILDLNMYTGNGKDVPMFMHENYRQIIEPDGMKYNHTGMGMANHYVIEKDGPKCDKTEKDGPADVPAQKKKILEPSMPEAEAAETESAEEKPVTKSNGRHPVQIAKDMSRCVQGMMNKHYQAVQKYAHSGDVRTLLQPLLPYFYLHEHTQSDTLLHTALASEQIAALRTMLSLLRVNKQHAPVVVNMTNSYKHTPLHIAVSLDFSEAVRELLDAGADPFRLDVYGNTSFHLAASRGYAECLSFLIAYVTDFNKTANRRFDLCPDVFNFDGKTPVHLAIESENASQCCDMLQKGGADLNIQEELEGMTLLHYTVSHNKPSLCSHLLSQHGRYIDIDVTTYSGDTPLYLALVNKRMDIAASLVASNASLDIPNSNGQTVKQLCEETPALHGFLQESAIAEDTSVST